MGNHFAINSYNYSNRDTGWRISRTTSIQNKENNIRRKSGLTGTINRIQENGKQENRRSRGERQTTEAEDRNNTHPIWDYQCKLRTNTSTRNTAIEKTEGTECQGVNETMKRWEEWTSECFRKKRPPKTKNRTHT